MTKSLFIAAFPALLFAGEVAALLENHNGESSYKVESPTQKLESKLDFPFEIGILGLSYSESMNDFILTLRADFIFHSNTTTGKDYDWHNGNLTVLSTSDNKIDTFNSYSIGVSKNIFQNFDITGSFLYKKMDISWSHTLEEDFVQNETSVNETLSLKYQQSSYQYSLGFNYQISFFADLQLEIEPSFLYTYIRAKDSHVLRNFYTMQDSKAFGYGVKTNISKQINEDSKIALHCEYETYSDNDTSMYYYNAINKNYLTLPSTYKYVNSIIGLRYIYIF